MAYLIRRYRARADMLELWNYISVEGSEAQADALLVRIRQAMQLLAEQPGMGRPRDDLRPGPRSHPVGRYLIFYFPLDDGAEIVRVIFGGRDIDAVFQDEDGGELP